MTDQAPTPAATLWDIDAIGRAFKRLPEAAANDTPEQADIRKVLALVLYVAEQLPSALEGANMAFGLLQQLAPPATGE